MIDAMLQEVDARLRLSPNLLSAARARQKRVQAVAASFTGWLRNYEAGSLAHGTPIFTPIFTADADCGMVLDRRSYPRLGPDGEGEGPSAILEEVRTHVLEALRPDYPSIRFRITKRAIKITFHDPLADGSDPTVDLIVALTRKDAEGLWIPNTEQERWDPSHPERHTELLADPSDPLREARALAIRLAKGENVSYRDSRSLLLQYRGAGAGRRYGSCRHGSLPRRVLRLRSARSRQEADSRSGRRVASHQTA